MADTRFTQSCISLRRRDLRYEISSLHRLAAHPCSNSMERREYFSLYGDERMVMRKIKLLQGDAYEVRIEDCCVSGEFIARIKSVTRDEDGDIEELEFSNGVKLWNTTGISVKRVEAL